MSDKLVYVGDSSIHGKGLFAGTDIASGTCIGIVEGVPTREDGDHVLWISDRDGVRVECDLRFINHSNTPNAVYYDDLSVCALRDIAAGEEITHDYGKDWRKGMADEDSA